MTGEISSPAGNLQRRAEIQPRQVALGAVIGAALFGLSVIIGRPPAPPLDPIDQVGFDQKLNAQIPLGLPFVDDSGRSVQLSNYFGSKPAILMMGYYKCPNLCDLVRQGVATAMQSIPFQVGRDYNVVAVSIDPTETPDDAMNELMMFEQDAGQGDKAPGIHFLTGKQVNIAALAAAIGFKYAYDPAMKQYAHPSGIVLLTPDGRISKYFYGIQYPPAQLRLGLVDASAGAIGSLTDFLLLRCYHYDPVTGSYSFYVFGLLQVGGMLTAGLIGFSLLRYSWQRRQQEAKVV